MSRFSYNSISASGEDELLILAESSILEIIILAELHDLGVTLHIPHNAAPVWRTADSSSALSIDFKRAHWSFVLLHTHIQHLSLLPYSPDPDLAFHSSTHHFFWIPCPCNCSHLSRMRLINTIEKFTRLREKCSHFAVIPARDKRLPIRHKLKTQTLMPSHLYSQHFFSCFWIPHSDVIYRTRREYLSEANWKCYFVNSFWMACQDHLTRIFKWSILLFKKRRVLSGYPYIALRWRCDAWNWISQLNHPNSLLPLLTASLRDPF